MEATLKEVYIETILLIERLHRRFLDVIKTELDRLKVEDINNVQTLMLYNINNEKITIGELTNRGYYLGSNVSYNVKKMVENLYLLQERSPHDRRSVRVKLSPKGLALHKSISESLERQVAALPASKISPEELSQASETMHKLERFWAGMINYGGG